MIAGNANRPNGNSNVSALQKINSYLQNTLDLRNLTALGTVPPRNNNSNSIDSMWADLVSGNTEANQRSFSGRTSHSPSISAANGNNIFNYQIPVPTSTNGTNGNRYDENGRASSSSSGSCSGGGANSGNNSPQSAGVVSSATSPSHFPYASKETKLSDPGSPSMDDALMMGIQRQQHQADSSDGITLADLMGSLNMSGTSSNQHNTSNMMNNTLFNGIPGTNLNNSGLNASLGNMSSFAMPHAGSYGMDMNHLTQLQQQQHGGYQNNPSFAWRNNSSSLMQPSAGRSFIDHSGNSSCFNLSGNSYSGYHNGNGTSNGLSTSSHFDSLLSNGSNNAAIAASLMSHHPHHDPYSIEKAAKRHRTAAAVCEATCTWSGQLPMRMHKNPFYSCKVFLGGVPWDVTETALRQAFLHFGNISVEWPGKENSANPPKGYVYILFDNEKQVKNLLSACSQDFSNGGNYYFKISSRRMRQKEVQVIPWVMSDSNFVRCPSYQLDAHKTVFIGALHGMLSAEALANIINDLFGGVVYAGIDTDKYKYPIGSGRITFNNLQSYRKAVRAAFVEIKTPKFTKKVQIDPYLADSLCQICGMQQGPYFCRDESCFKYFCRTCWLVTPLHQSGSGASCHKPLMRNSKLRTQTRLTGLV